MTRRYSSTRKAPCGHRPPTVRPLFRRGRAARQVVAARSASPLSAPQGTKLAMIARQPLLLVTTEHAALVRTGRTSPHTLLQIRDRALPRFAIHRRTVYGSRAKPSKRLPGSMAGFWHGTTKRECQHERACHCVSYQPRRTARHFRSRRGRTSRELRILCESCQPSTRPRIPPSARSHRVHATASAVPLRSAKSIGTPL